MASYCTSTEKYYVGDTTCATLSYTKVTTYDVNVCAGTGADAGTKATACTTSKISITAYSGSGKKAGLCDSGATTTAADVSAITTCTKTNSDADSHTIALTSYTKPAACATCPAKGASALAVSAAAAVAMISLY